MNIGYLVGVLILPIVVVIVAIVMRLINRERPLKLNHYIIVWVVFVVLMGINMTMPINEKITYSLLASIILGVGFMVDKALKINQ